MENRVEVLIEALPYIKEFYGKFFVIKYGGAVMVEEKLKEDFCKDVILLHHIGIKPVVVHGGGREISSWVERLSGKKPRFINGLRETDAETLEILKMVLIGKINTDIVVLFNKQGGESLSCGLSGVDDNLIIAVKDDKLQYTGQVASINPEIIYTLDKARIIPIIAPIGYDPKKNTLVNINADIVAAHIAVSIKAYKFIILTDTEGIYYKDAQDKRHFIPRLTSQKLKTFIEKGDVEGGMLVKTKAAIFALEHSVPKVHIIDGRRPHSLLLELFTDKGIGTLITN